MEQAWEVERGARGDEERCRERCSRSGGVRRDEVRCRKRSESMYTYECIYIYIYVVRCTERRESKTLKWNAKQGVGLRRTERR